MEVNPEYQLIVESNNIVVEIDNEICKISYYIDTHSHTCTCNILYVFVKTIA